MPKKEKVVDKDNQASLTTSRVDFLNSKQKKKNSAQNQDNWNHESIVSHPRQRKPPTASSDSAANEKNLNHFCQIHPDKSWNVLVPTKHWPLIGY
jgi:hypothetical protein